MENLSERIDNKMKELQAVKEVLKQVESARDWYMDEDENGNKTPCKGYEIHVTVAETVLKLIQKQYNI